MQFIYQGLSYNLDINAVAKDLELIYLKAMQREPYSSLTEAQTLILEVAWNYFAVKYLAHDNYSNGLKGEHLYYLMQMGYVEKIAIDGNRGEMIVQLAVPVIVN